MSFTTEFMRTWSTTETRGQTQVENRKSEIIGTSLGQSLVESIDAALGALGNSTRDFFLLHLRNRYNLSLEDIPERMEEFLKALHAILGSGARVIEKLAIARMVETDELTIVEARGKSLADIANLALQRKETSRPKV